MGAIPAFAAITVWADNRTLYPQAARAARLTVCDLHLPRWENCPAEYATRVDMAYDPATERMAIDEWVLSGDVLDERYAMSERHSTVQAMLGLWWGRR